jgi:hypothetical protein
MSASNRPLYFCARPNGNLTPLIAVDELPTHLQVHGVPRTITVADTHGMTSCGISLARAEPWIIDDLNILANRTYISQEALIELQSLLNTLLTDPATTPNLRAAAQNFIYRGIDPNFPVQETSNSNNMAVAQANAAVVHSTHGNGGNGKGIGNGNGKQVSIKQPDISS